MIFKKRYFTLIEVIVSLLLIGIIMTLFFGYFTKISKAEIEIDGLKKIVYQRGNFQVRLNNIFAQLYSKDLNESAFYTEYEKNDKNLCFNISFDNGVDPDPNYSNIVKAKIYVDKTKDLILEIFSKDKKTKITRQEILFSKINSFECQFLSSADELKMKTYEIEKISDNLFWYNFWPKERKSLPSAVLIKIDKNVNFAFFLPNAKI
jgi:hypothetical protein